MTLEQRMKLYYEMPYKAYLTRRTPVVVRVDGKAAHTYTKALNKPFDEVFVNAMFAATRSLCEEAQGCVLAYTQSHEISIILLDYQTINTDAWFGYSINKLVSICASSATAHFNSAFRFYAYNELDKMNNSGVCNEAYAKRSEALQRCIDNPLLFDARAFNLPKEEVCNYLIWRQNDARRNSISSLARVYFSHKEVYERSGSELIDMMLNKGIDYDKRPDAFKRGACYLKKDGKWTADIHIPVFSTEDGRSYVDSLIFVGE